MYRPLLSFLVFKLSAQFSFHLPWIHLYLITTARTLRELIKHSSIINLLGFSVYTLLMMERTLKTKMHPFHDVTYLIAKAYLTDGEKS